MFNVALAVSLEISHETVHGSRAAELTLIASGWMMYSV